MSDIFKKRKRFGGEEGASEEKVKDTVEVASVPETTSKEEDHSAVFSGLEEVLGEKNLDPISGVEVVELSEDQINEAKDAIKKSEEKWRRESPFAKKK